MAIGLVGSTTRSRSPLVRPRTSDSALAELQENELRAGRYAPVTSPPGRKLPISDADGSPGGQHDDVEEAREAAGEDGTASILDMEEIGDEREFATVVPLSKKQIVKAFGTEWPSKKDVLAASPAGCFGPTFGWFDKLEIGRGEGVCFPVYARKKPTRLCFGGVSFD